MTQYPINYDADDTARLSKMRENFMDALEDFGFARGKRRVRIESILGVIAPGSIRLSERSRGVHASLTGLHASGRSGGAFEALGMRAVSTKLHIAGVFAQIASEEVDLRAKSVPNRRTRID